MEILGNLILITITSGLIFSAYLLGKKQNTTNQFTIKIPEIKVVMPTEVTQAPENNNRAVQLQKDYETFLEEQRKEQSRLPDERKILSDVNETVNSIYEAFLNGTPIEEERDEAR